MWSVWIVGSSAWTNQSDTNADAAPATTSRMTRPTHRRQPRLLGMFALGGSRLSVRYCRTQVAYTIRIATAPTIEIVLVWWLAGSCAELASPISTMMNVATSSSVAVSLGSRGLKRMTPSRSRRAPATITSPSTSSALTRIEPDDRGLGDDRLAGVQREDHDEELGQVAERRLQEAGDSGTEPPPTCSVENDTIHARPASASVASTNASTSGTPCA